ncbi:MAG: intein-containing recombinase RecA [Nitriliruptorales bacterium]
MDREKALDLALQQIEKQFGQGALMKLGADQQVKVAAIPTGALSLDLALGIGGLPRGRVIELFGSESSGKSTMALHAIAEAQKLGGIAAFIDAEHALDPVYAKAIGVDVDELLVSQPDTGEQALEIADMLVRSGAVDIIIIDSVAALVPRVELEGEMGDTHVGLQARLMSQALRKLTGSLSKSKTCCVFINQLREKVGVMFGSPITTPGGRALKFYSSVRLEVRRIESLKDGSDFVGNRTRVKVVKNKCLAAGAKVFDPTTGLTHRIEEIVDDGVGVSVWAVDKKGHLNVRSVLARMNQGEQEVIGLVLRDGTTLKVTPDHRVMTDRGWRQAGELEVGDRLARPRRAGTFGDEEPITQDQARLLGYLIGDGYVGGKTPIGFINTEEPLHQDVAQMVAGMGCDVQRKDGNEIYASISHRQGEKNEVLELVRWAGIWGHLAPDKKIPAELFGPDVSEAVIANLIFGIWESDGWISREQTGGLRLGFVTTSEQLAQQLHWLLLRWGIGSAVKVHKPGENRSYIAGRRIVSKLPCYQVRVSGIDNVRAFADAIPMWGPKSQKLTEALSDPELAKHRGSQRNYLSKDQNGPVLDYLHQAGVTPPLAASMLGMTVHPRVSLQQVLGIPRLRRDRLQVLATALDSQFLRDVLSEEVFYDRIFEITEPEWQPTYDLEVEEDHTFVAEDVVMHNCGAPFRQAEFDILYGEGISKEGSILDVGVEAGIVKKAGAWYQYDGEQLGQGRETARQFLKEHDDIAREIEKRAKEALGITLKAASADEDGEVALDEDGSFDDES